MKVVKKGDTVKVEYVGSLEDGTVFDSSEMHKAPLEFVVGEGKIIKGFEKVVIGMKIGDEKEIKVPPKEGYGQHNPELVREMPKECFPEDQVIQIGMIFMINLQDGRQIPVKISAVTDNTITVDANHPLAGKTLLFKIKIIEIG